MKCGFLPRIQECASYGRKLKGQPKTMTENKKNRKGGRPG